MEPIAVLAGTPVDTRMGVDVLSAAGLSGASFPISPDPREQTAVSYTHLTCGGSGGGLDIVGLCLSKRGSHVTVGKFSLAFNAFLYTACLILFIPQVAIYSVIYNFFSAMVLDRTHQQNVSVQALIFTKGDENAMARFIIEQLGRSVTYWNGTGAYTGEGVHVLCVCLSKFEIEELVHTVHTMDPHAFVTTQEGTRIYGNFQRRLG